MANSSTVFLGSLLREWSGPETVGPNSQDYTTLQSQTDRHDAISQLFESYSVMNGEARTVFVPNLSETERLIVFAQVVGKCVIEIDQKDYAGVLRTTENICTGSARFPGICSLSLKKVSQYITIRGQQDNTSVKWYCAIVVEPTDARIL